MPLFRSQHDFKYIEALNKELIEKIIGEKITYYPISKKNSETNIYGESSEKIYDPPVQVYGMIEWKGQDITSNEFGQDVIYNLTIYFLQKHLEEIDLKPFEGDMVDYNTVKFEIHKIRNPDLLYGKTYNSFNLICDCRSVRRNVFNSSISASVDLHKRTRPDNNDLTSSFYQDPILFPFTGSIENL